MIDSTTNQIPTTRILFRPNPVPIMQPTIIFVPGFWVGPTPFDAVSSLLQSAGFPTQTTELLSTGTTSPGNPSMLDDVAHVRSAITKLVDTEKDVVIVSHSGGAFVASNAIEDLGAKARAAKGLKGGVVKLVFVAGALFPEGYKHQPLPFFDYDVTFSPKPSSSHLPSSSRLKPLRVTGRRNALPHPKRAPL